MVDKPAFKMGDHVEKISGSSWRGRVVGTYSTDLTAEGYAVESDTEKGSVQIYPAKALRLATPANGEQVERANDIPETWSDDMGKALARVEAQEINGACDRVDLWMADQHNPLGFGEVGVELTYDDVSTLLRAARRQAATPTEDARSRVKVLEEALRNAPILGRNEEMMEFRDRQDRWLAGPYRTALGNKETDRHG